MSKFNPVCSRVPWETLASNFAGRVYAAHHTKAYTQYHEGDCVSQSRQQKPGLGLSPVVASARSHVAAFWTTAWKRHSAEGPRSQPMARAEVSPPPASSWQAESGR